MNSAKNTKRILLTGGAGYIGAVLTEKLLKKGYDVTIYDTFHFGDQSIKHLLGKIEVINRDIRKVDLKSLSDIDTIIHLAGFSNDPTAEFNPEANFEINTIATEKMAKKAKKAGVKRFIFASSCSIYDQGVNATIIQQNEISKVSPTAPYSHSKYQAELKLLELSDQNFCVIILRKGTVFGFSPRMRFDLVINAMVKTALQIGSIKIFAEGKQWRPLIDIEDVAEAYIMAVEAPEKSVNGEIINISYDNFQIKDVAISVKESLIKHFSIPTNILFEENNKKDRSYKVSTEKAEKLLKFKAKNTIENSVMKIVQSFSKYDPKEFDNEIYYNISWMKKIFEKNKRK